MSRGRWLGKLIGGTLGFLLSKGSLLGLLVGVALGHQFDGGFAGVMRGARNGSRGPSRRSAAQLQKVFFESVFLAMGHIAKADGRVSAEEIQVARSVMHQWRLGPEEVNAAIELFTRGKSPDFPIDGQILKMRDACRHQPELIRTFLEALMEIPLSKGKISAVERSLLWRIAGNLGVGRVEMAQLEALMRAQRSFGQGGGSGVHQTSQAGELQQAYKALGIEASATDKEVKTAYRRLINRHHPDKLVAKGLPDSMMEIAKERTREIRGAYETIRDHRGMR